MNGISIFYAKHQLLNQNKEKMVVRSEIVFLMIYSTNRVIKNIEDHKDQITPLILYERSHNYDWSIRAVRLTNKKTRREHVNKLSSRRLLILY